MGWKVPRIWDGGEVWIIGGGPSLPKQFNIPDEIVRKVFAGEAPLNTYSNYMTPLHKKHVIGVNVAYLLGNWVDMVFFGDSGFFLKHLHGLARYSGIRITCHSDVKKYDWVKFMARDRKAHGLSSSPEMICWNNNSGAASINVAVHTGAKRIILVGFDMKLSTDAHQHWHNAYGKGAINMKDARKMMKLPFQRHLRGFPDIARDAKKLGIEILNASPDSAIQDFKKVTVKELL
jgi:hypothetical protein